MRIIQRIQFDRPQQGAGVVTANAMLPAGMIVLSLHQWMSKLVVFIDMDEKAIAVDTPVVFIKTGFGPAPHPTTYAGSVIMVDNQEEWHLYFGMQKSTVTLTKESTNGTKAARTRGPKPVPG